MADTQEEGRDWSKIAFDRYLGFRFNDLLGDESTIVTPTDRRDGIPTNFLGKETDGKWHKVAETTVDGYKVDVISKDGISKYYMFPDGTTCRYDNKLGAKQKVAELRENEARNEAQEEADKIKEQREQAEAEIKAEKEYQQGKREEYEKEQQKYGDYFNSLWGEEGQPTMGGFVQKAMDSANAYAKQQAKQQAQDVAQQAAHGASNQAMQAAVNAGMSPAQAALMGGQSSTAFNNAYGSTYQNTFDKQQQSYLGKQTEEIGLAQQQQNRADQNYNTATQNIYQQNNRQDDYLGVAQQERDYYNGMSQQELQKQLQIEKQKLAAAQTAINTITGLIEAAASFV